MNVKSDESEVNLGKLLHTYKRTYLAIIKHQLARIKKKQDEAKTRCTNKGVRAQLLSLPTPPLKNQKEKPKKKKNRVKVSKVCRCPSVVIVSRLITIFCV